MSDKPQNKVDLRITPEFAAQAGKGRVKGVPNKVTKALKDMILTALENKGGVEYLEKQADENPTAFLTLVGKVLPLQVAGDPDNPLVVHRIELVAPQRDLPRFEMVAPQIEPIIIQ